MNTLISERVAVFSSRVVLGSIFLWAFLDKLFGLSFATVASKSWLSGVSPTAGFLQFGVRGPFSGFFNMLSGNVVVDWLFMAGLLGIGLGLVFGLYVRFSALCGIVLMLLMWLALLPPEHHPIFDEHIVYSFLLYWIIASPLGEWGSVKVFFGK